MVVQVLCPYELLIGSVTGLLIAIGWHPANLIFTGRSRLALSPWLQCVISVPTHKKEHMPFK